MTRFAGSAVDFTPQSLQSAGGSSNYASAGAAVDLNDAYAAQREKSPRYDELANVGIQTRSNERQAAMQASADVTAQGIAAIGQTKGAQLQAQASVKAAQAKAQGAAMSGAMGAIGSIGSALIGLSDESTKTAITPIDSALAKLRELKPVTFYYRPEYGDHTRLHHGFVAQEYQKVMPDATYTDEATGKMCIDTTDLIGLRI